jgi:hypothetical protein
MTDGPKKVETSKRGNQARPLLRKDIEEAQLHTNSNRKAAMWLGVSPQRYSRYAKLYGLYERHSNKTGIGTSKGFAKRPTSIPLREVLAGKHPHYSRAKLKNRLIARKKIVEKCALCGFEERRVTDGKIPLIINHKDGDKTNFTLENLELLCYNCLFLTTGAPQVAYRGDVKTSLEKGTTRHPQMEPTESDMYDPDDIVIWQEPKPFDATLKDNTFIKVTHKGQVVGQTPIQIQNEDTLQGDLSTMELTPEEIQQLQDELMKE